MTSPRERLADALGTVKARGSFSARRTLPPDALPIEVRGIGPLETPVTASQARQLCRLGHPAQYGKGEHTLLDRNVRDTWEVPKSRVKVDRSRWSEAVVPVLDHLRGDLGLPGGCRLRAELHSMLVYAPGQFFVPHQDSEKADAMVGSLVVTLPSTFRGGALVVEHMGKTAVYRASKNISFVAFYSDCRHQVQPVRSGYRVVLTYNLLLEGTTLVAADSVPEPALVEAVATCLDEHFATPSGRSARGTPLPPPSRLVYLLDHEYTAAGLSWMRLKGDDAGRVALLAAAADRAGCEAVLARAEVHETWSCFEPDRRYRSRYRRWDDDEDDGDAWEGEDDVEPDDYELVELVDWGISIDCWLARSGNRAEPVATSVGDHEVCATTPSRDLSPYTSEYEGYMGNYGNTMDHWYRRGAVAVWPRTRAFAVRAEAAPGWALDELQRLARTDVPGAREAARTLETFWVAAVRSAAQAALLSRAMRVAARLDEPALAALLLRPFYVEVLARRHCRALAALVGAYGEQWAGELLDAWFGPGPAMPPYSGHDREAWIGSLPRLCTGLHDLGDTGTATARLVVERSWSWLWDTLDRRRRIGQPSRREESLRELARPIGAVLESAGLLGATDLRDAAVGQLGAADDLLETMLAVVRAAGGPTPSTATAGLDAIAERCAEWLKARLAHPPRAEDDWAVALPPGCTCDLCSKLGRFLADPAQRVLEWPVAQDGRRHVHGRIDAAELPVRHQTRRTGRPFTLVLTKTDELFEREHRARSRAEADMKWLSRR